MQWQGQSHGDQSKSPLTKFVTGRHRNRSKGTILSQHAESVKRCATTGVRPQLESNLSNVHSHRAPSWKITCSSGVYRVSSSQYNTCSALHRRSKGFSHGIQNNLHSRAPEQHLQHGAEPRSLCCMRRSEDRSQAVNRMTTGPLQIQPDTRREGPAEH